MTADKIVAATEKFKQRAAKKADEGSPGNGGLPKLADLPKLFMNLIRGVGVESNKSGKKFGEMANVIQTLEFRQLGLINLLLAKELITQEEFDVMVSKVRSDFQDALEADFDVRHHLEVVERSAKAGDAVIVTVSGTTSDGTPDVKLCIDRYVVQKLKTRPQLLPEIEDAMIGMSAGDERTVEVTLPEGYPHRPGETVIFTVCVLRVKSRTATSETEEVQESEK